MKSMFYEDKPQETRYEVIWMRVCQNIQNLFLRNGGRTSILNKSECCSLLVCRIIFDINNQTSSKKKKISKPLIFKIEVGKIVSIWDESL